MSKKENRHQTKDEQRLHLQHFDLDPPFGLWTFKISPWTSWDPSACSGVRPAQAHSRSAQVETYAKTKAKITVEAFCPSFLREACVVPPLLLMAVLHSACAWDNHKANLPHCFRLHGGSVQTGRWSHVMPLPRTVAESFSHWTGKSRCSSCQRSRSACSSMPPVLCLSRTGLI